MQTNTALCSKQSNSSPTDCQSQSDTILLDYARKGGSFGDTQFTTTFALPIIWRGSSY